MVNKQLDPENDQFSMETSLNQPPSARVYVNLPEGSFFFFFPTSFRVNPNSAVFFFEEISLFMDDESQYHHDNLRAQLDGRSGVWRNAVEVDDLAYFLNGKSMTWGNL